MAAIVYAAGLAVAGTLLTLIAVTLAHPPLRIWPTPGRGTWQSHVWWPLFRGLNALCVLVAALDHENWLGLPGWARWIALAVAAGSTAVFVYSFRVLGRDNSYGAADGLVTGGIYEWSRNPQNAMLMLVYVALGLAAASKPAVVLCAAMVIVYFLMVGLEEPWLEKAYGDAYRDYCRRVPRFFKLRRLFGEQTTG